jgi:hypothetical protein
MDPSTKAVRYTPMFGAFSFRDPAGRIVIVRCNQRAIPVDLKAGARHCVFTEELPPQSFIRLVSEAE